MKRRTIGPAYERAPAEKLSEWGSRNLLVLLSSAVIVALFWLLFNVFVDHLIPFLASDSDALANIYSDHPVCIAIKVIGGLLILFINIKVRAK